MAKLVTPEVPVIIDPGTHRWRVGLANVEKPRSSFMTELSMLDNVSNTP